MENTAGCASKSAAAGFRYRRPGRRYESVAAAIRLAPSPFRFPVSGLRSPKSPYRLATGVTIGTTILGDGVEAARCEKSWRWKTRRNCRPESVTLFTAVKDPPLPSGNVAVIKPAAAISRTSGSNLGSTIFRNPCGCPVAATKIAWTVSRFIGVPPVCVPALLIRCRAQCRMREIIIIIAASKIGGSASPSGGGNKSRLRRHYSWQLSGGALDRPSP